MAKQLKHLIIVTDHKDPFPIKAAIACYEKWGVIFLTIPDIGNDALNHVFSNEWLDDEKALDLVEQSFK